MALSIFAGGIHDMVQRKDLITLSFMIPVACTGTLHTAQLYTQHDITHPTVFCRYFVLYDIRQDAQDVAPVISTCMLRL